MVVFATPILMRISAQIDEADSAVAVPMYAVRPQHAILPIDGVYDSGASSLLRL